MNQRPNWFPDDIWTFDDPGRTDNPNLNLREGWNLRQSKVGWTPEGGLAVKVINGTGSTSVKGTLVHTSASFANTVELVALDIPDTIGVVYTAGVANGEDIWVVISGIAEVLFVNASTAGYLARSCMSTDVSGAVGKAFSEAFPTSPFATDKHFMEIGHIFETKDAGLLVKVALHFN